MALQIEIQQLAIVFLRIIIRVQAITIPLVQVIRTNLKNLYLQIKTYKLRHIMTTEQQS